MKVALAVALAALAALPAARAAAPGSPTDPKAAAAVARMQARLAHARTMTFTVTLTGPGEGKPLTITGQFQKPDKLALRFARQGREIADINSDGRVQYLSDPQAHRYLRHALGYGPNLTNLVEGMIYALPHGQTFSLATMRLPATLFGGDAGGLLTSLCQADPYLAFFGKDPLNPPEPLPSPPPTPPLSDTVKDTNIIETFACATRYTSCVHETLSGEAILHLSGRVIPVPLPGQKRADPPPGGMRDYGGDEWFLDAATLLPRRHVETQEWAKGRVMRSEQDYTVMRSEQDYTAIQTGDTPLPPATFSWTPPPDARPAHMEKIPPPGPL